MQIKASPFDTGDSFVDLPTADAYHALRRTTAWTMVGDDLQRSAALVLATDYISANYRLAPAETLNPVIPQATMMLAPQFVAGFAIEPTDNRAQVTDTVIGPGGMEATTQWVAIAGTADPYPQITAMLAPALVATSPVTVLRLVR